MGVGLGVGDGRWGMGRMETQKGKRVLLFSNQILMLFKYWFSLILKYVPNNHLIKYIELFLRLRYPYL